MQIIQIWSGVDSFLLKIMFIFSMSLLYVRYLWSDLAKVEIERYPAFMTDKIHIQSKNYIFSTNDLKNSLNKL